jgi:Undecaprenyl-phosphate galactose phosphotransferase WbaP
VFALAWVLTVVLVPLCRRFVRGWCSRQPWWGIPTIVISEGSVGEMMLGLLEGHHRIGLRPIAILTEKQFDHAHALSNSKIFHGDLSNAKRISEENSYSYAVIAMPNAGSERVRAVYNDVAEFYRRVLIIPDLFGMRSLSVSAKDLCGILALEVDQTLNLTLPHLIKRAFDLVVSLSILVLCAPLFVLMCLAVRISSPGPIFYGQRRIGKSQRVFRVWKFRSMVVDAEEVLKRHLDANPLLHEEWERDHKLKADPRVTWVGRILRKSSLDELPQLWNVICGEMSIVGPRPITHVEVERYGSVYDQYLRVTPGVTGLWQISGRNNTTYDLRIRIDDYYVRNWSLSLDLYILLRTLKTLMLSEGAY